MSSEYILRIDTKRENYETLSELLGIVPTSVRSYWDYTIDENSDLYYNALDYLLDLLIQNIEKIHALGISNDDLSIWYLYEYDEQCNMEFHPRQLKKFGELDIVLCISCWQGEGG